MEKFQLTTSYVGAKDTHLTVTYPDFNQPITLLNGFLKTCTAGVTTNCNPPVNARRPNQFFQRAVAGDKSNGASTYNGLQVKLERRVSKAFVEGIASEFVWESMQNLPTAEQSPSVPRIAHNWCT